MAAVIGIVGGVGPYAGLDLNMKIFDNTVASKDQDYPRTLLASFSDLIGDRTSFLKEPEKNENPGIGIAYVIEQLSLAGAFVIGMPCNTAHSESIFSQAKDIILKKEIQVEMVHMIEATFEHILNNFPSMKKIGLLSTLGTISARTYHNSAEGYGIHLITPCEDKANEVHHAIYNAEFGIKAFSNPVKPKATQVMEENAQILVDRGAEAVIMGCTEIPLSLANSSLPFTLIDPTQILARTLLSKAGYPLKPLR